MIYVKNIILGNYQLLKNIKKNYNGIALGLDHAWVSRRSWTPCKLSIYKIYNKVHGMIYVTNIILGKYQLLKNIKKKYNGIALA